MDCTVFGVHYLITINVLTLVSGSKSNNNDTDIITRY